MSILGKTAKMAPLPGEACKQLLVDGFSKNKVVLQSLVSCVHGHGLVYEQRTKSCVFCSSLYYRNEVTHTGPEILHIP